MKVLREINLQIMLINSDPSSTFSSKEIILVDNDFLSLIYESKDLFADMALLLNTKKFALYPFTEFEFLRNVFIPKDGILKEKFINSPLFRRMKEGKHVEIFEKIYKNALLLSKIYAHQGMSVNSSFVDLFLGSLLMFLKNSAVLVTGNKKDFPKCIFDTVSVLNFEAKDGGMRAISVVEFNQDKFDDSYKKLLKLES